MHGPPVYYPGQEPVRRGRPPDGERAQTNAELKRKYRAEKRENRLSQIAVLDMETDPFEDERGEIHPFCCELYSDQFGSIVIWEEDYDLLIEKLCNEIQSLPDSYIIYAHNGGKFDYMFMVHKLRGTVRFKGRAIMSAKIGNHEIRDSLHILPEKLAAWKKDTFDYTKMRKGQRGRFKTEILAYLHSDCIYLFDFVKSFTKEFGLKISIGQAAFAKLKQSYKITPIKETMDTALRPYFLGGRVECISGKGLFGSQPWQKPYKLYDVNSMYPHVMASRKHPVSGNYLWHRGMPNENTFFIDLSCKSYGAFFNRLDSGELTTDDSEGRFFTTIWEYQTALKYDLIENVNIHWCVDNHDSTTFADFVIPMYLRRQKTKEIMAQLKSDGKDQTTEYEEIKKENIFLKYLLNNAYGKCAQNPRKYKEFYYTDANEKPPKDWFDFLIDADDDIRHEYSFPYERCEQFAVWARPSPGTRYNNVGTAASITGASRAMLLEAKQNAVDPLYCDTDSLICRELKNAVLSETELGAWKIEETFNDLIIVGKKTYCCQIAGRSDGHRDRLKVRSKGVDLRVKPAGPDGFEVSEPTPAQWEKANAATWDRYLRILDDETVSIVNRAPTFDKIGQQHYLTRRIRATAPLKSRQPIRGKIYGAASI